MKNLLKIFFVALCMVCSGCFNSMTRLDWNDGNTLNYVKNNLWRDFIVTIDEQNQHIYALENNLDKQSFTSLHIFNYDFNLQQSYELPVRLLLDEVTEYVYIDKVELKIYYRHFNWENGAPYYEICEYDLLKKKMTILHKEQEIGKLFVLDSKLIGFISGANHNIFNIFNLKSGELLNKFEFKNNEKFYYDSICSLSNKKDKIIAQFGESFFIYSTVTGELIDKISLTDFSFSLTGNIIWSYDDKLLAMSCSSHNKNYVVFYDRQSRKIVDEYSSNQDYFGFEILPWDSTNKLYFIQEAKSKNCLGLFRSNGGILITEYNFNNKKIIKKREYDKKVIGGIFYSNKCFYFTNF